jgi:hypothetical protein
MSTNGSISPIAHAARVLADVLATVPDGAIEYAPIGQHDRRLCEYGAPAAYVRLQGPGAVDVMHDLGATTTGWQSGIADGQKYRIWTAFVKGVEFSVHERREANLPASVPA